MADDFDISGLKSALGVQPSSSASVQPSSINSKQLQMSRDSDRMGILQSEYSAAKARHLAGDASAADDMAALNREMGRMPQQISQTTQSHDFDVSGLKEALNISPATTEIADQFKAKQAKPMFEAKTAGQEQFKKGLESIPGVKELGAFGNAAAGAISQSMGSVEQLVGQYLPGLSDESRAAIMRHANQNIGQTQQGVKEATAGSPNAALAGELTGYVANPINKLVPGFGPAATGLKGLGQAAGQGAVQNVLTQPVTNPDEAFFTEKLKQAGFGAAGGSIGSALLKLPGAIAEPVKNALTGIGQDAVKTLRNAGIPLDVAQATGSSFWARTKAMLSDNIFTSTAENTFGATQKEAFNKAIAKTMGEDATNITPAVIQDAKTRLGQVYDDVASRNNIHYDKPIDTGLKSIGAEAEQVLNPEQYNIVKKQIDNIVAKADAAGGGITGKQYQEIKKVLDKISGGSDSSVGGYAREIKDTLLEGLTRTAIASGNKADVAALKAANKQYGNMKKIEDVVLKYPEGNVSPSLLMNSLATKSKRNAFYSEDSDLAKLASAGKLILENKTPNSGTVARLAAQAAPAAVAGGLYGAYQGDLGSVAKGAAVGFALPKAIQAAANNPALARYFEKGMQTSPLRSMLEIPGQLGKEVPQYAAKPGIAGATALRQMINQRNLQEQQ